MITDEAGARQWLSKRPECDGYAAERLEALVRMLGGENERQNLVSRASFDEVWRRHVADSAQLCTYVPRGTTPWLDMGAGAGFPGLVIAILRPECEIVLVESRAKRAEWLARASEELGLENVEVQKSRLEDLKSRRMSVISARAFAPLDKLLILSARFSTNDTIWLLPKGRSAQQELDDLRGWRHKFHVKQSVTEPEAGIIVGRLIGTKGNKQ